MPNIEQIEEIISLTQQHLSVSPDRILLGRNSIPPHLRTAVATQLSLRRNLEQKLPSWTNPPAYIPAPINLEQASSQVSAVYKQRFLTATDRLLDLSGGLGVDFLTMVSACSFGCYAEEQPHLHQALQYNASLFGLSDRIALAEGEALSLLPDLIREHRPSLIYVDPARREHSLEGRRVYALEDCSPNLYELLRLLCPLVASSRSSEQNIKTRLLAKVSPMLDLRELERTLPRLSEIHIVSVRREVKELLLLIDLTTEEASSKDVCDNLSPLSPLSPPSSPYPPCPSCSIIAVDISASGEERAIRGTLAEESQLPLQIAHQLGRYLYEPNGAVMKSGLYRTLSLAFGMPQLHPATHIYTSDSLHPDFVGRILEIEEEIPFSSSVIKKLKSRIPEAMISCRNFPLQADELRKKLGIRDRGERVLVGVKLWDGRDVLLYCKSIS